ncbi:putative YigZ family protein [Rhizobium sp. SG_E_25_P2]|uniref:IMPACT family protein n=1 Tax=Rhizobium sp. SG_E_25_P2 TaxID=2879942 RepID=UPI00247630E5|nr:YigZ family protein [Rhizobium sp. SG_E_25_P2]MDH6265364.1 putative YigZ family protein [Rhizobium sp. SG_E_25_P2]
MQTITAVARHVVEIKKSRFIVAAAPVTDEAAAKAFIASESDASATHNCWAYRIGQIYRFNDDGEPSGTAGKPILQAIDGQDLDGVAVVVTRFFGGVLLGSGGLIRAYGGSVAECLRAADKIRLTPQVEKGLRLVFSDHGLIKSRLERIEGATVLSEAFGADGIFLRCLLPSDQADGVIQSLIDLTSGRLVVDSQDGRSGSQ